ncbi:hypothetical protein D9615_009895 [Tricholomella constricta]|uniref:Chromatin elongation factor SPT5 n=1 Tax=Tricholomella constricta TaxID=117010 RepID=A0A8H5GZS6_9AGAR|nr:hypothetical protein D9615_009895 [Tricholomella constricta]
MEAPDARLFLSLEATVDDASEEEEEHDDEDDGFLQDDDDDDDEPVAGDRTRSHHLLALEATRAEEDGWDSLLDRARARGRTHDSHLRVTDSPPRDQSFFVGDPHLWRVAVQPGCEEAVAFVLMRKLISGTESRWAIQSIIGRASRPGWIVVEATKASDVQELCQGVANVFCKQIHIVEPEDGPSCLKEGVSYTPFCPSWLRLTKHPYRGDLAYVRDFSVWGADVIVVPRINFLRRKSTPGKRKRSPARIGKRRVTRPEQNFFEVDKMKEIWGHKSIERRNQAFLFKGKVFLDGYLCLQTDDFYPEAAIPSPDELELFRRSKSIPEEFFFTNIGDHGSASPVYRVVAGEAQGTLGIVESIADKEAVVRLSYDNVELTVPLDSLRKKVTIGDEVIVAAGPHKGVTGWVMSNIQESLVIYNHSTTQESSFNHRRPKHEARIPPKEEDLNVGRHVRIIGHSRWKDYEGIIKSTESKDMFVVEVQATMRREHLHQSNLALLNDPGLTPLSSTQTGSSTGSRHSSSISGSDERLETRQSALPLVPSTPLPPASSVSFSPAWNPSSRTPNPLSAFPYNPWMESPLLEGKRIKVQFKNTKAVLRDPGWSYGDHEGKLGLWVGTEASSAKIVLGVHSTLLVPEKYVQPIVPSVKGQNVVVLAEEGRGMEFCVVSVGATDCVVRNRHGKPDPKSRITLTKNTLAVVA